MAKFIGTKREFKRYIGPILRNIVQQITRKYRQSIGRCEHCGRNESLEAAHINGRERNTIIDSILEEYGMDDSHNYEIDLKQFESKFEEEHNLIDKTILILCRDCHIEYDSDSITIEKKPFNQQDRFSSDINMPMSKPADRLFSNKEIQRKISDVLRLKTEQELEKYLDKDYSKEIFNIDFPLLIKVRKDLSPYEKRQAVKDNNINRWTWKFEFQKGNYSYAICTQWYDRHDIFVKNWLENTTHNNGNRCTNP